MKAEIDALEDAVRELFPRYEELAGELGPLCFKLAKKLRIQARGRKGCGIAGWCRRNNIDRNRFNYLCRKYALESQRKKGISASFHTESAPNALKSSESRRLPPGSKSEAAKNVENQQASQAATFADVRGLVNRCLAELGLVEQLTELRLLRDWLDGQILDLTEQLGAAAMPRDIHDHISTSSVPNIRRVGLNASIA